MNKRIRFTGSRTGFDEMAALKRSVDDIKEIADNIEKTVQNRMLQEVKSSTIGEMVLSALKDLDHVSYIRYASVYKNFQTAQDLPYYLQLSRLQPCPLLHQLLLYLLFLQLSP